MLHACYMFVDFFAAQIRFYPRTSKLDNNFCHTTKVPSQIMLLNTFRDILIVMCADCHIMLFHIERKNTQPSQYNSGPRFKKNLTTNRRRNLMLNDMRCDHDLSYDSFRNAVLLSNLRYFEKWIDIVIPGKCYFRNESKVFWNKIES